MVLDLIEDSNPFEIELLSEEQCQYLCRVSQTFYSLNLDFTDDKPLQFESSTISSDCDISDKTWDPWLLVHSAALHLNTEKLALDAGAENVDLALVNRSITYCIELISRIISNTFADGNIVAMCYIYSQHHSLFL
jgi:hypothetical protein